jgi:hypothetical protein
VCGSCAHGARHVGGGEAELTDGGGEEVEGVERDVAPSGALRLSMLMIGP